MKYIVGEIWLKTGPAGVVLILLGVACVYFTLKNTLYLCLVGRDFSKISQNINDTPMSMEETISKNKDNPLAAVLFDLMHTHRKHSDDLKAEVAFLFYRQFRKVLRDITLIRVIALISPMLGLLGTLLGLLGVFKALAVSTALETSTILAAGIWEAILTTVMGLVLAIPSLVVYFVLNLHMKAFMLNLVEYGYRFFDAGKQADEKQMEEA